MIITIIPEYIEGTGNCTKIKDNSGEHISSQTVKSVIKSICGEKLIDLKAAKKRASKILGQSNLIPIYISKDEVLMPIRVRKPRIVRDGGYGYINFTAVEKIVDKQIIFKDKSTVNYIDSKRSLMKRCKMAQRLAESFSEGEEAFAIAERDLTRPATREDIVLLLNEILRLKRIIEEII